MNTPSARRALANRWDKVPDLDAVRVFAAVAELRSFRGAATALGLPRSTVSRRLAALEASLGTRLLQRTTRQVSLTGAGEVFLAEIAPSLQRIGDASRQVLDAGGEPRGVVRLTATPGMAERVGAIMLELAERHPHVRVELDFSNRQVDLVAEGFDLALRAAKLSDSSLIARHVGVGRSGYFASPDYLKGRPRLTHPSQLAEHACVVFSGSTRGPRWAFQVGSKLEELRVQARVVVNSLEVARLAARRGHGVTWLPETLAREDVERAELVAVLKKFWLPPVPFQLVYPSARHVAPQVRAAIELLVERLKAAL